MAEQPDLVAEARERVESLRASLPQCVDVAALGVRSKAPYQLLCTREALIWRTEELARNACDALERNDFAVAAVLTRAVTENAAMTWALMTVLNDRSKYTPEQLNDRLMRFLAGSKSRGAEAPKPVHVNDLLRSIEKEIPGVTGSYDSLSEIAHPNWSGVAGMYSKANPEIITTYFGRGLHAPERTRNMIANAMLASLSVFEFSYNRISDVMPAFLAELERF
jgi:hypothetical protein